MVELKDNLEMEYEMALTDIEEWTTFNDSRNLLQKSGQQTVSRQFNHMISWIPLRTRWWILDHVHPSPHGNYMERSIWRYMIATKKIAQPETDIDDVMDSTRHLIKLNPNVPQDVKNRF